MQPRTLRAMAALRWLLLALVTLAAAYTTWHAWGPGAPEDQHAGARYYCAMHPQVRSQAPGECPICHMSLEPIPAERAEAAHAERVDGPHPTEVAAVALPGERQRLAGMATSPVERATLGERVRVPAVVTAPEGGRAEVRVRAPGFVEKVAVRESGVRVQRGQVLAWVYSPELYRAQEEYLASRRWQQYGTAPAASGTDLLASGRRALALLGMAEADIDELQRTGSPLRAVPVRAPSSGYVTRMTAVLGGRADPADALYELADLTTIWVVASVREHELPGLKPGSSVAFLAAGNADPVTAKIALVEPGLDEQSRAARVRMVLDNRRGAFRPGQAGEVEFSLPATAGLFVPRDAVIQTGEHTYVFVAAGQDAFVPRSVTLGAAREDRLLVLDGLQEGERVVTRGTFVLDSESRLKASLAATPAVPLPPGTP